jgi:hypothetical protein
VDDEDFEELSKYKWHFQSAGKDYFYGYAIRNYKGKRIRMHRVLTNAQDEEQVDHINCNPLDNRRKNLRICTNQQNGFNRQKIKQFTSKYKGVYWNSERKRWWAMIRHNGKQIFLGSFTIEKWAAEAYDMAAKDMFKEFALTNF